MLGLYIVLFILGTFFGSFSSVIIYRLHNGKPGIWTGRSACTACKHKLGFFDLIPILSATVNRFRCRYCKEPIALRYPLLELFMGTMFVLTTYLVGLTNIFDLVFFLFMTFIFVLLTFFDILYQEVPDEISLPVILVTLIYVAASGMHSFESAFLGFLVPVLFFGLLSFGSRGRWLGGGDIRIGALMGLLLGWPLILMGLFWGYLAGSVYSAIGMIAGKLHRKSHIPFAPFLLFGAYISLFWGREMLAWYMGVVF